MTSCRKKQGWASQQLRPQHPQNQRLLEPDLVLEQLLQSKLVISQERKQRLQLAGLAAQESRLLVWCLPEALVLKETLSNQEMNLQTAHRLRELEDLLKIKQICNSELETGQPGTLQQQERKISLVLIRLEVLRRTQPISNLDHHWTEQTAKKSLVLTSVRLL